MWSSSGDNKCSKKLWCHLIGLVFLLFATCCLGHAGDSCDWNGSGLSNPSNQSGSTEGSQPERGVQPLYLRCRQGRIRWSYPSGALRLVLRLQGSGQKEFRACLRLGPVFQGARIYLEGHRRLHMLYSADREDPDDDDNTLSGQKKKRKMQCFTSVRSQAALYVEAISNGQSLKKTVAEFAYDLQPLSKEALANELEECRPCTEDEVIQYYCSSDYVIRGTVSSLSHDEAQDRSEMEVRVVKAYRDSPTKPILWSRHDSDDTFTQNAILYRHLKCQTKPGSGEFLFMGRRLLGDPYVTCAPRLSQWKALRRKAIQEGSSPCLLD